MYYEHSIMGRGVNKSVVTATTTCIGGYLFAVVVSGEDSQYSRGVALEQIMQEGLHKGKYPLRPIKCN